VLVQVSAKKTVAVSLSKMQPSKMRSAAPVFQTNALDVGKAVSELLIANLVPDGNVTVIERDATRY
jgi:hypothetical protein